MATAIKTQLTITSKRILIVVLLKILPLRLRLGFQCWKPVFFSVTIQSLLFAVCMLKDFLAQYQVQRDFKDTVYY